MATSYPIVETSDLAWEFARAVTGYGYDKPAAAAADESTKTEAAAAAKNADVLDYSKWDTLAKEIESEEAANSSHPHKSGEDDASRLLQSIQESRENPAEAFKALGGNQKIEDDPNADPQDVSAYFADNPMRGMGGCAHDRSKERAVYERPNSEKLRMAKRFRTEGNQYFSEKDYGQAATFYRKALLYYDYTIPETEEEIREFNDNKLAAHLNLAAAHLNLKQYKECRTQCYQATQLDPKCTKAYYRYGQAYMGLDEYDTALEYFEKARSFSDDPNDSAVTKAIHNCLRKKEEWKIKSPALYRKMFEGATSQEAKEDEKRCQQHSLVSEVELQESAEEKEAPPKEAANDKYGGPEVIALGSSSEECEEAEGATQTAAEETIGKEVQSSSPEPSIVRIFSDQSPILGATAPPNSQVATEGDSCSATAGSSVVRLEDDLTTKSATHQNPTTMYKLSGDEASASKDYGTRLPTRSWWYEKDAPVSDHKKWLAIGFVGGIMTVMTLLCFFACWEALRSPQERCISGTELLSLATVAMPIVTVGGLAAVWVALQWGS